MFFPAPGGHGGGLHQQRQLSDAPASGATETGHRVGSHRLVRGSGGQQRGGGEGKTLAATVVVVVLDKK